MEVKNVPFIAIFEVLYLPALPIVVLYYCFLFVCAFHSTLYCILFIYTAYKDTSVYHLLKYWWL